MAVARISHVPHLLAVLVAGRLADAPADHLALSGQGVRDVTRIAGGDPALWQQIVTGNAAAVLELLGEVRGQLDAPHRRRRRRGRGPTSAALLDRGVAGTRAIPGKHGGPTRPMRSVFVSVPDHPGELARLFADAGASEVNIEDVHIDHDPGRPVGLVELLVDEAPRRAPAGLARIPRMGDPPVGCGLHRPHRQHEGRPSVSSSAPTPGPVAARSSPSTDLRVGQVEHLARRRRPAGPALPRHRRDVPGDDLVDAARTASTSHDPAAVAARVRRARDRLRHRPAGPDDHRRRRRRRRRDPQRRRQRRGLAGQRRARGARPAARAPARGDRRRARRHRRRGPRHRLRGRPGRRRSRST